MRRNGLLLVALGAGAFWASRQPGGLPGTWQRLQQGARDIAAGQDPRAVGKRFIAGTDEEPAGMYAAEADEELTGVDQPYRDMVSSGI